MFWSKEFWPPNSPDLNPLNYYVWSVERVTNKSRHFNVTSLRTAIETAFVDIDSATLQRACQRFRPRIEAVIQANEGYRVHYKSNAHCLRKIDLLIVAVQMLKILQNTPPLNQYTCGDVSAMPGRHAETPRRECLLGSL